MDDYKLPGKDEVREIMGGCSDQMAYRVIPELNSELREKGIATVQGKVSKKYLLERYFGGTAEGGRAMSVTQAENGTWEVSVWYKDWQGERKRKHKRGFATKREAKAWENAFVARQDGSPDMRMHGFYELYREGRMPHLKPNTWRTKEQIIETKILPFFGEMKLCDIMPADILKWQSQLLLHRDKHGKPYSDTYLRTVSNQLSSLFNHACRYCNLPFNPVSKSGKMGNARSGEMRFWTKDEYERFSREVMDKPLSYLAFEILYWTGIREGELLALTPADFNFRKNQLSITKSYQRIDCQDVITCPKTPKSTRVVKLPDFLVDEIAEHLICNDCDPDERIFKVSKSFLYHEIERAAGLPASSAFAFMICATATSP